jgi:hypothetical protein
MSPEGKKFLDDTGLGNHPELVKAWASVGALLAEDGYIDGQVAGVPSADEAAAKITAIESDRTHAAWHPENPGYKAAQAELERLYKLRYGTGPAGPMGAR